MKCHYEILEVDRNADSDEIKKKYRKLALKWHPDKNPDNIEECTKFFALLQQAYEVLSDPQERDFYDRHRESILKGGFDGEYKDKSLDLFKYFSTQCYKGYESDEKGFFAVYRKVFQTLANEDYDEMEKHEEKNYPEFGDANSDYEKVVGKFYGFWSSFTTIRSFAWLDQYDIRQASNRWETRKIEQENKKFRDVGKQERNEQIRQLVSFVRKRDPRVKAYKELLEKKQEEAKMKQIENRKKQILQNQLQFSENKAAEAATLAHLLEVSMQMAENDSCSDECDEDGQQLPFCVVCNKSFKTENAKINHENSKLHIKQLNELKKHMKEEDALLLEASPALKEAEKQQKEKKNKRKDRKKGNGIFDYEDNSLVQTSSTSEVPETSVIDNKIEEIISKEVEEKAEEETEIKKEKKKRRADKNKAAANLEAGEGEKTEDMIQKTGKCDRCKQVFESRSKLFAHLKLTGHATLLVNKKSEPNKKGKKNNKKKDDDESW